MKRWWCNRCGLNWLVFDATLMYACPRCKSGRIEGGIDYPDDNSND